MVIPLLDRKLLRQIRRSWMQSLAVSAVVMCGAASYILIASAHRNLLLTRDTYYAQNRFADFEMLLERAPTTAIAKLETIPGVRDIRARIVEDVTVDLPGVEESRVGRIISMPDHDEDVLNDIVVLEGRYFEPGAEDEVIVSRRFAQANSLDLGDRIQIVAGDKKHSLRVVGFALSPEYVYMIRSLHEMIPSPERFGILWVPEDFAETVFDMREACNNFIGTVDEPRELERILEEAENVLSGHGVYAKMKRDDQISHRFLSDEITGLGVSAKVVPSIFLGVAALILMVILNRLVRQERTAIGLLKACGYGTEAVFLHYVKYALFLCMAGCAAGFLVGQWLSTALVRVYIEFFEFPILRARVYPDVLARSMGIAALAILIGAAYGAIRAARLPPAESMRPEPPRFGRQLPFESVPKVWRRLSFTWKMILRNMVRSPFRAALMALGVAISTALLILCFFSNDAMDYLMRFQFEEVQREDMKVNFAKEFGKKTLYEVQRIEGIRRVEPLLEYPFEFRAEWRKKNLGIIGITPDAELRRLLDTQGQPVEVTPSGLLVSERLAGELGLTVGSPVHLRPLMGRINKERVVPVSRIVRQYFGISAYMHIDALSRLLDEPFAMNAAVFRVLEGYQREVNATLKDVGGVASVEIKTDTRQNLENTLAKSNRIQNIVMVFFAGVIAFAVIYTITTVALAERERELASLRVLGFTVAEVGRILYNENFSLAGVGILLGIPLGVGLTKLLVTAYDTDLYRFPFHIDPDSYVKAVLLSLAFVILSNLAVRRRIAKLDLVEVLKSPE